MGDKSLIPWTDATINFVTGCTPVSEGCENCYAKQMAKRLQAMGAEGYEDGFAVRCHPDRLQIPITWKKPRKVFVCSMGDLFHTEVPDAFLDQVFDVLEQTPQHLFQILTKRHQRMKDYLTKRWDSNHLPPSHIWIGVTAENQKCANERIPVLLDTPASKRFVSIEPYLEMILLTCLNYEDVVIIDALNGLAGWPIPHQETNKKLDWVIVGSESGPKARKMYLDWVQLIRDECVAAKVPFFFKQKMQNGKKVELPELDGVVWDQMPTINNLLDANLNLLSKNKKNS